MWVKRNIRLLYAIRTIRAFLVIMPIIVPFFYDNRLSQTQIYIVQSAYATVIVLLEIPSGYYADYFGRKQSLLVGASLSALGFIFYSLAHGFWLILLADIILGIGYSFISGADAALAYDSLLAVDKQQDYRHFEARSYSFTGASEAIASILGGLLALASLRTPVVVQASVYLVLIPLVLMLKEPPRTTPISANPFAEVWRITRYALYQHHEINWLIFYGATLGTLTHTMVWITQPYYQLVGVPLAWFGAIWAAQLLAMALFSYNADKYERWFGKRRALVSFTIIGFCSYVILALAPSMAVLPAILGFYFIRGVHIPILQDYINALVASDIRATVLSVKNLAQKLLYALLGPLVGVVVDAWSLQAALLFSAIVYGSLGVAILYKMKKLQLL